MFKKRVLRTSILVFFSVGQESVKKVSKRRELFFQYYYCPHFIFQLDSLEYVHSHGYIHKDIKGSNLLLGRHDASARSRLFLLDFGLRSKYIQNGVHKPYEPDRRWAHEGTLEYTSRDCHLGCFSRRGDIEVLFYNMVEWMGGKLPWEDLVDRVKPPEIQRAKIRAFADPPTFLADCFKEDPGAPPEFLGKMMVSIEKLRFEEAPDYQYLRCLFSSEIYKAKVGGQTDEMEV